MAITTNTRESTTTSARKRSGPRRLGVTLLLLLGLSLLLSCSGSAEPGTEAPAEGASGTEAPAEDASGTEAPAEDASGTEAPAEDASGAVITISEFEYQVPESIPPGTEITVRNEDSVTHTVTSDEEGVFDVVVEAGSEATLTVPDEAGSYGFYCTPHPYMTSTLVVG